MSKKLAKIARSDGWDLRLEEAVSTILQSGPTDDGRCDIEAVVMAITALTGVTVSAKRGTAMDLFERWALVPVNRFNARRGDIGIMTIEGRQVAGVVSGLGFVVRLPHGASIFTVSDIEQAFKIGA